MFDKKKTVLSTKTYFKKKKKKKTIIVRFWVFVPESTGPDLVLASIVRWIMFIFIVDIRLRFKQYFNTAYQMRVQN